MAARLNNRKVQTVVICLLAAVVVYNAVHFLGKKSRKRDFDYESAGLGDGTGPTVIPAWATGEYTRATSWGVNPFTGRRVVPQAAGAVTSATQVTAAPTNRDSIIVEYETGTKTFYIERPGTGQ